MHFSSNGRRYYFAKRSAGLLVPTGMVANSRLSPYFHELCVHNRVRYIIDFENRLGPVLNRATLKRTRRIQREAFFPDVHKSFRFSVFVTSRASAVNRMLCAFVYSRSCRKPETKLLELSSDDFALLNPNTKTAVFFANQRDVDLSRRIYRSGKPVWLKERNSLGLIPVVSTQMLNMSTDRGKAFIDLDQAQHWGFYPAGLGLWKKGNEELVELYVWQNDSSV